LLGPGRLILIVGPSGAGKDAVLSLVRLLCEGDRDVVFPRRVVTRPSSEVEDHDSASEEVFDRLVAEDALAFWWKAHGLRYGIPSSINADIRAGRTVLCNTSRTIVNDIRARYLSVTAVLITAPREILEARLQSRKRPGDGPVLNRINRSGQIADTFQPDITILNDADLDAAAGKLFNVFRM
jgi:ribose 1,5-bisphosphokinase